MTDEGAAFFRAWAVPVAAAVGVIATLIGGVWTLSSVLSDVRAQHYFYNMRIEQLEIQMRIVNQSLEEHRKSSEEKR